MSRFTYALEPKKHFCEEPNCSGKQRDGGKPFYAALSHFCKKLCWGCSSKESGKIREEPKEFSDARKF
jgi:hypothetical protein